MNNEQLIAVRKLYEGLHGLLSNSTLKLSLMKSFPSIRNIDPERIFWLESLQFMVYISNADGEISQREVNTMNYITGEYLSLNDIRDLVSKKDLLSDFNIEPPLTAKILCVLENLLYQEGEKLDGDHSIMNMLIMYYEAIGTLVADSDDCMLSVEYSRIKQIVNQIKKYAAANTLSPFYKY